jgi:hypothetical protein
VIEMAYICYSDLFENSRDPKLELKKCNILLDNVKESLIQWEDSIKNMNVALNRVTILLDYLNEEQEEK